MCKVENDFRRYLTVIVAISVLTLDNQKNKGFCIINDIFINLNN